MAQAAMAEIIPQGGEVSAAVLDEVGLAVRTCPGQDARSG